MPIFEFECVCGKRFERICSFDDSEKKMQPCPVCCDPNTGHCTAKHARKLVSAPNARFKGAGFYNTTYQRSEKMDKIVEQSG